MDENRRRRRSSFFPKPVEESSEKQFELFNNMNWVDEEKRNILSRSVLFGAQGKKTLQEHSEKLKCRKQEYAKLVFIKQEEHINLKEKLRKSKLEIKWDTACENLTHFEKEFANNRPDYKGLVEKVHLLTIHIAVVKRANYELNSILNAYNRRANEEIHRLQKLFINKIIEDSGVGTSYNESDINSSIVQSSDDEHSNSN